ncbi:DNA translocase FtsK [Mahella sp.]|uniref:FtsK/SpoIIIE family DNA translocase n=1 Tax=Mahella sp. TaxID=2798721 RepID=UPI0025C31E84|nr:DNA translocase FtsK [Mahella sp.]MBZ4666276.1 translocase FtsK [Mahella sp.]MDK2903116.1 segregation ATPase FtsK/SpoIIIE, family [Clostridiales bacterium]
MAQKKYTKRKNTINNRNREWIGIGILAAAAFTFVSVYTQAAGIIGSQWRDLWFAVIGIAAFLLPIAIAVIGILFLMDMGKRVNYVRLSMFVALCAMILGLIQIWFLPQNTAIDASFSIYISNGISNGLMARGTGFIGSIIAFALIRLFGIAGSYIITIAAIILLIMALTGWSVSAMIAYIAGKLSGLKKTVVQEGAQSTEEPTIVKNRKAENAQIMPQNIPPEQSDIKIVAFQQKEEIGIGHPSKITPNTAYSFPSLELLSAPKGQRQAKSKDDVLSSAKMLEDTLTSFGISAKVLQVSVGPAITRYEIQPGPGVKVSRIIHLADDIALNLAAPEVRIEAPIPGKAALGIEVPNENISPVLLREVLESKEFINHPSKLAFGLGKDIAGRNVIGDLSSMPHLLIAGATGSGKSVCINAIITSILYKASPEEVKMLMIDPKVVELSLYNGIPHLLIPVVTDPKKAAGALNWAVQEMTSRYKLFADKSTRDIFRYNEMVAPKEALPQIVVIIDELSDLMMIAPGEVEDAICRLAQMARAAGIHLVIATQRPSVDVITGVIKANIPSRIAFAVSSQVDSRTILDGAGAEKLLGKGDMLYYPIGAAKPMRVQGAYVSEKEAERIVDAIKDKQQADYDMTIMEEISSSSQNDHGDNVAYEDELFNTALEMVVQYQQASVSFLQKRLRIGYVRAARLIDEMEARGYIGPYDGSKPRQVLITEEQINDMNKTGG